MDTSCCRWLLWITLTLVLHRSHEQTGSRRCPQGQLLHVQSRPFYLGCCYPVRCGVGQQVIPCVTNGTKDTCSTCGLYQNQSLRTSSFTMDRCTDWPLNQDCKNRDAPDAVRNITDERMKRCMCNIEQGMKFVPPESASPMAPMPSFCQRRDPCKPGFEPLVDGGCAPCRKNYFKATIGSSLCEPKTNCTLLGLEYIYESGAELDNVCSQADPIVTNLFTSQKPHIPTTVLPRTKSPETSSPSSTPSFSTAGPNGMMGVVTSVGSGGKKTGDQILWPIVGSLLVFLAILVAVGLVVCWRRKKLPVCVYAKDCANAENNHVQGSTYEQIERQVKHQTGNGSIRSHNLITGNKVVSNGINGGVHSDIEDLPNGHAHQLIPPGHFNQAELGSNAALPCSNSHQFHANTVTRPGVPKAGNKRVMFRQRQTNWPDLTLDIDDRNRQQALVSGYEANSDLGEADFLLVPEQSQVASPHQITNLAVGQSPVMLQDGVSTAQILALNDCRNTNFGHFVTTGQFSPSGWPHRPAHTSPVDTVKFTRSVSLIASPEGEVDEDDRVDMFPRFSQLLQDGDESSVANTTHDSLVDSHQQPVVHQQPLAHQQPLTPKQPLAPKQPPAHQLTGFYSTHSPGNISPKDAQPDHRIMNLKEQDIVEYSQAQPNNPDQGTQVKTPADPTLTKNPSTAVSQKDAQKHQPDHRIMNLKEQDLVASLHSNNSNTNLDTEAKTAADPTLATSPRAVVSEGIQQLKTKCPPPDRVFNLSTKENAKRTSDSSELTLTKQSECEGFSNNLAERNRHISGGAVGQVIRENRHPDFQGFPDRKRVPSGGISKNGQQFTPSCDRQRPHIKSQNENETPTDRLQKQSSKSDPRQSARSQNTSESANSNSRHKAPLRLVSDPEQVEPAPSESDIDEPEWSPRFQRMNASSSSSKTSVYSDCSGTDESNGNPTMSAVYRRSQSHNAPNSSESPHKPPPRSMSEEKPQKLDRPVAKVKPMPASDSSVNQLPVDLTDNAGIIPPLVYAAATVNHSNAVTVATPSGQQDMSANNGSTLTLEVDEDEGLEVESTETGV